MYREDWVVFHKYLLNHFENHASLYVHDCLKDFDESRDRYMVEAPKVHMRPGDFADIYADWIASDDIYDQKYYRSVHYILKYRGMYLEVQVRTLFEEGWGEIEHSLPLQKTESDADGIFGTVEPSCRNGGRNGILLQTSAGCSGRCLYGQKEYGGCPAGI